MRRVAEVLLPAALLGLALASAGCRSGARPWVEPEDHSVKVVSEARFLRTEQGDYVDGYLAEDEARFGSGRMFIVLEITRYVRGEWLDVTGRFTGGSVRLTLGGRAPENVPVFEVERAAPHDPKAPDLPPIK
ncbi:MAG TPA: hypothetical protein P5119_08710 [Candidatus Aminicenantes bacterium]|nr:hypothetical protein [Candidatus Aminicenantes bacterium]HRY65406.1 hypothetical protein [Candidatus Aminicenantes bacterium]HRZ72126.1 hypothetical protein [Candidatus Aminicenantes bacterium]